MAERRAGSCWFYFRVKKQPELMSPHPVPECLPAFSKGGSWKQLPESTGQA